MSHERDQLVAFLLHSAFTIHLLTFTIHHSPFTIDGVHHAT